MYIVYYNTTNPRRPFSGLGYKLIGTTQNPESVRVRQITAFITGVRGGEVNERNIPGFLISIHEIIQIFFQKIIFLICIPITISD